MEITTADVLSTVALCIAVFATVRSSGANSTLAEAIREASAIAKSMHSDLLTEARKERQLLEEEVLQLREQVAELRRATVAIEAPAIVDQSDYYSRSNYLTPDVDPQYDDFYSRLRPVIEQKSQSELHDWLLNRYRLKQPDQWVADTLEVRNRQGVGPCLQLIRKRDFARR